MGLWFQVELYKYLIEITITLFSNRDKLFAQNCLHLQDVEFDLCKSEGFSGNWKVPVSLLHGIKTPHVLQDHAIMGFSSNNTAAHWPSRPIGNALVCSPS